MPRNKDLDLFKRIGLKIRNRRKELNISQEKLSEILDVEYVQIWRYETGKIKIPLDYLIKIAGFLNTDINYFFNDISFGKSIEKEDKKLEKILFMVKEVYKDKDLVFGLEKCVESIHAILKKRQKKENNADFKSGLISGDAVPGNQKYVKYLPVYSLEAAASDFSGEEHVENIGWKKVKTGNFGKLNKDMFIAKVVGKSMETTIPDGSYCVFRFDRGGSRNGTIVLVESKQVADPETNQKFTVKRYQSEKEYFADGTWIHKRIILSPANKEFKPIILENVPETDFRVVAEFIGVI